MVSPFSGRKGLKEKGYISLFTVVDTLLEGRACLATNLATYMMFMSYSVILTSTKLFLTAFGDQIYQEWQFLSCDVFIGVLMISFMAKCGPAEKLASFIPTASLFGPRTFSCVVGTAVIHWVFLICIVLLLLYGSGKGFYEPFNAQFLEIPAPVDSERRQPLNGNGVRAHVHDHFNSGVRFLVWSCSSRDH